MPDGQESGLDRLTADDIEVVRQCLRAAVNGTFFPDWEFSLLIGPERDEVAEVLERWPDSKNPEIQDVAVNNVLNNFLGYPGVEWDGAEWREYISVGPREVAAVLSRWGGEDFDDSARGYFDRMR